MSPRDGHVRVLPLHVANKIAAGEVVERPASVAKELLENAIDAGARKIVLSIAGGGRKLVAVQDDGSGMTRDDAVLALERQATSKILDVDDIEEIDTLGFRGEAIPSIASVSRFTIKTRRADSDEGTLVAVNAGQIAEVSSVGCPPGTLVEVRDLFCNVPARRKFLRAYATEEAHVKQIFTVHALAHPQIAFSLVVDGRETYNLPPATDLADRVRELFGADFLEALLPLKANCSAVDPAPKTRPSSVRVTGYVERPNPSTPTRRDQYVFVNGRPATAPSIAYALREGYPHARGDAKPAAILFIETPPGQVDVNVHPTKREVRFRDNVAVRTAVMDAIAQAVATGGAAGEGISAPVSAPVSEPVSSPVSAPISSPVSRLSFSAPPPAPTPPAPPPPAPPAPAPVQVEFAIDRESVASRPWVWFKYLATTASGYLLLETDAGVVTINPMAARERIAYERLTDAQRLETPTQALLIPEVVRLSPVESARIGAALADIRSMGFRLEPFGQDTWKIDAIPQHLGSLPVATILATVARDLAEGSVRRTGEKWREQAVARSIARSFAGTPISLDEKSATRLVEELAACRMPYVCPRGKPIMIFTSTRELNRKFSRD